MVHTVVAKTIVWLRNIKIFLISKSFLKFIIKFLGNSEEFFEY